MGETRIETRYDERFGTYVAVAPDQSYCTGIGRTPEEARERLELALELWFDPRGGRLHAPRDGGSSPAAE